MIVRTGRELRRVGLGRLVQTAALAAALAAVAAGGCKKSATGTGNGGAGAAEAGAQVGAPPVTPATGPTAPDVSPSKAESAGAGESPSGEAAAMEHLKACRSGGDCSAITRGEWGLALKSLCREEGGTRCDETAEALVSALEAACGAGAGPLCANMSAEERSAAMESVLGIPQCTVGIDENDKLHLSPSISRLDPGGGARIDIETDSISCNNQRAALLREENGVRVVDDGAKSGGRASFLIDELKLQLERFRQGLEASEARGGRTFPTKGSVMIVADRATPARVLKEVLSTAAEAGYDRYMLFVHRAPGVRAPGARGRCGEVGMIPVRLGRLPPPETGETGEAPVTPAAGGPAPLRLTAILTKRRTTLMVDAANADQAIPVDPATGVGRRVELPHLALTLDGVESRRSASCPESGGAPSDECANWTWMKEFVDGCFAGSMGEVQVPDLMAIHDALRGIADRLAAAQLDGLPDRWEILLKSEDDIPICQLVAVADVARFRDPAYDWTADAAFKSGFDESVAKGTLDPMLDPASWNDPMRAALLFPVAVVAR